MRMVSDSHKLKNLWIQKGTVSLKHCFVLEAFVKYISMDKSPLKFSRLTKSFTAVKDFLKIPSSASQSLLLLPGELKDILKIRTK